jgi:hypothetical protein
MADSTRKEAEDLGALDSGTCAHSAQTLLIEKGMTTMMRLLERWFRPVDVTQDYRRMDYALLFLIIAVGAILRFWGLGNVGLHGDEETMAMPAMAILETGDPYLPSGMYYARALLNIYLMSGSAYLFGESEWAFRLPSAVVGSLTGVAAYFMGRRFLAPQFNLAFVATITLLPSMIVVSQTARMYVFLVTCLIWFGACVFRWERDQRATSLVLALVVWSLALHFHTLAMFAAPLFLFPGLSRRSWPLLGQGFAATLAGGLLYYWYSGWISSKYPEASERPAPLEGTSEPAPVEALLSVPGGEWVMILSALAISGVAILLLRAAAGRGGGGQRVPVALVVGGLLAMAALQYHAGGLLLLFGIIFRLRSGGLPVRWLLPPIALAVALAAVHLWALHNTGLYAGRQLIGALIGWPSLWPILRFLEFSPAAGVLYVAALCLGFWQFSKGTALPKHFLFFAVAVWGPLLVMGLLVWDILPRYSQGQIGYFLLCAFAGLAFLARTLGWRSPDGRPSVAMSAALVLASAAMINPVALARVVHPGYDMYPDHQGAARYIQSLELGPEAVLIAEDILQQTYYLGEVEYFLREYDNARNYAVMKSGQPVDQYTGARIIGSGAALREALEANRGKPVYIIGSGENFEDGRWVRREWGINDVLQSDLLEVVYTGRDGKTQVWRLVPEQGR